MDIIYEEGHIRNIYITLERRWNISDEEGQIRNII